MKYISISLFIVLFQISGIAQKSQAAKLQNKYITVEIIPKGAEIISFINNKTGQQHIWRAGKAWQHHAPLLFPIVGKLKNRTYFYKGISYRMKNHGFAAASLFNIVKKRADKIVFQLKSNQQTNQIYPFDFLLTAEYKLLCRKLKIKYKVLNTGKDTMYFAIGVHPGFNIPYKKDEDFEQYFLEFQRKEFADRLLLDPETRLLSGTIQKKYLNKTKFLNLNRTMFKNRVIVLNNLQSRYVRIRNNYNDYYLEIGIKNFPFLGLWSPQTKADLICIEPWFGHSDFINTDQDFTHKKDLIKLPPGEEFEMQYYIKAGK